jgi:hypothetical protein
VQANQIRYNDTDTLGGNSGSGVLLNADGTIAGVHTNGGCAGTNPETGFNFAQRTGALLAVSPILSDLVTRWASLEGVATSDPGAVLQTEGRLVVFVQGTDNSIWHRWQMTRNGEWSGWESIGAPPGGGNQRSGRGSQ